MSGEEDQFLGAYKADAALDRVGGGDDDDDQDKGRKHNMVHIQFQ